MRQSLLGLALSTCLIGTVTAEDRAVIVSLFIRSKDAKCDEAARLIRNIADAHQRRVGHRCLNIRIKNITSDPAAKSKLDEIADFCHIADVKTPFLYCCNRVVNGYEGRQQFEGQLERLLLVELFSARDCLACEKVPDFKRELEQIYPGFHFEIRDISSSLEDYGRLRSLENIDITARAVVPAFHLGDEVVIGAPDGVSSKVKTILETWTIPNP
jgi:hypothetical protein